MHARQTRSTASGLDLRAVRLVVDTGIHSKRWTRDQAIQYARDHGVADETGRYVGWPAQALSYMIGPLTFSRLRERAREQLGPKFSLAAFHDQCIDFGALPMDVLEERIEAWIAAQKAAPARPSE